MYYKSTSRFNPYSYDELVKPLIQYKAAYDEVEKDFSTLAAQTEAWKDIATRENNPKAYEMYKKYSDDFNKAFDDFNRSMTIGNRDQLLNMKRRYAREIYPIAKASEELDKAIKYRQEVKAKDPSAIFVKDYNSIDNFLHGKKANNEFVSTKDIMTRMAAKVEVMSQDMLKNGYTPQSLLQILEGDFESNPYLSKAFNEEFEAIGLDRFSAQDRAKLRNAAGTAVYAGIQSSLIQAMKDQAQRDASARGWAGIKLEREKMNQAAAASAPRAIIGNDGKPTGEYYDPKLGVVVDAQGNLIGNPKSKNSLGPQKKQSDKRDPNDPRPKEMMTPLYFDAYYNDTSSGLSYKTKWDGNIDKASKQLIYSKGKHVTGSGVPNKLSKKALADIRAKLPKGMSLSDVDIYVDHDSWTDSHYIVVDARGDILGIEKVEGPATPTSGSKGTQSAGM